MKKLFLILICLCLCACSKNEISDNEITILLNEGYENVMSSADEEKMSILLVKDDDYKIASFKMNAEEYAKLNSISILDDDYDQKMKAFLANFTDITITNLEKPSEEEFSDYVLIGDLENDGYENMGYLGEDNEWILYYSNNIYDIEVKLTNDISFDNYDDLSKIERQTLKIDYINFDGFGSLIFD